MADGSVTIDVKLLKEQFEKDLKEVEKEAKTLADGGKNAGQKIGGSIVKVGKALTGLTVATVIPLGIATTKMAANFEEAFTGVTKTVDGTAEELQKLHDGILEMSGRLPSTASEIAGVAQAAGQLGIKTEDILDFTEVMINLGNSTNLSAEEAASSLAKFANVTQMSSKDYDKLGSVIVALGNNFATTEADIVQMGTRLAATGQLTGLSQSQIMALATAMSSVGIEAEAGGTAMSKLLKKIETAVATGGKDLKQFASVSGMSVDEFKQAWETDAVRSFIKIYRWIK